MSISLFILFSILVIHWIADFILQTDWQARNKSKNNEALFRHCVTYISLFLLLFPCVLVISGWKMDSLAFTRWIALNFAAHFCTDYLTSRLNSHLYAKGDIHNFFIGVGGDQVCHYVTLILTYVWLLQ